jgi:hypothetical protein
MLSDIWPLYRLKVTTDRLVLRLPNEHELAEIAEVAGAGIHLPSERPFLTPWTEGTAQDRALSSSRTTIQSAWSPWERATSA